MPFDSMAKKSITAAGPITPAIAPLLREWQAVTEWLTTAKARETELRIQLADFFIPISSRKEGANHITTRDADGKTFVVTVEHKISRKLDEFALDAVMLALPETSPFRQQGVLIQYKPELVLGSYRTMPEDELKIFQQALEEKPGMPTLKIAEVPPEELPATPIMDAYEQAKTSKPAKEAKKPTTKKKK